MMLLKFQIKGDSYQMKLKHTSECISANFIKNSIKDEFYYLNIIL